MGGLIALTLRFSDGTEYRGSCHTNVLPYGLGDVPFYVKDKSEAHTKAWIEIILNHRKRMPEVETLWGGHKMLAPASYGILIVDYKTSSLVSMQGYTQLSRIFKFDHDDDSVNKWKALEVARLLEKNSLPLYEAGTLMFDTAAIKMPFDFILEVDPEIPFDNSDDFTAVYKWVGEHFTLSDAERAAWSEFAKNPT